MVHTNGRHMVTIVTLLHTWHNKPPTREGENTRKSTQSKLLGAAGDAKPQLEKFLKCALRVMYVRILSSSKL